MTADAGFLREVFGLEGRRGVVTGASRGLGASIALALARAGAEVHCISRGGKFEAATDCAGLNITHHAADITDADAARAAVGAAVGAAGAGGLDFLINNAGVTHRAPAEGMPEADWRKVMDLNLDAAFRMCQLAFPFLKDRPDGGRVVNIASMAAHLGFSGVTAYAASKAALGGMTRGLAVDWAPHGILVNSISPGWFKTELLKSVMDPEREKKILARMPLHRFGAPENIARAALYLVSPAGRYVTGIDLAVDGGALAFGY